MVYRPTGLVLSEFLFKSTGYLSAPLKSRFYLGLTAITVRKYKVYRLLPWLGMSTGYLSIHPVRKADLPIRNTSLPATPLVRKSKSDRDVYRPSIHLFYPDLPSEIQVYRLSIHLDRKIDSIQIYHQKYKSTGYLSI
jgi:hypothetical protein